MNLAEKIYVVIDREISYNLCSGGKGGFSYINRNKLGVPNFNKNNGKKFSIRGNRVKKKLAKDSNWSRLYLEKISNGVKKYYKENNSHWIGRKHSQITKNKMSHLKKEFYKNNPTKHPQIGTCWINNGNSNKKIKKENLEEYLLLNWKKGRILNL